MCTLLRFRYPQRFIHLITVSTSWSATPSYLELLHSLLTTQDTQDTLLTPSTLYICNPRRILHSAEDVNGQARLYSSQGDFYEGECVHGRPCGRGELHYANGCWYEGTWVDGKRDGHGVYKYCENVGYEGDWEKDRLVKREAKPEGVFDFESGTLPFLSKEELVWRECGGGE